MPRRITRIAWLAALLSACWLWVPGCETSTRPPTAEVTYTYDSQIQKLISILAGENPTNPYQDFDQHFSGLFVPASLFAMEPFVLGLSTESRIPTILLLKAHWVKRYGEAGWLHVLERSQINISEDALVPAMAQAFSVVRTDNPDRQKSGLMAVPTSMKGNILFFRKDILARHRLNPPRNWDELQGICRKILPQEKHLKYGLLLHPIPAANDFYPVFWGFGGRAMDDNRVVMAQPQNQAAFLAALKELQGMQGTILPAPQDLRRFEPEGVLEQSFFQGEALFMISWNTRMHDLSAWLAEARSTTPGRVTALSQVGVVPIPSRAGCRCRYSNLDSLGWAVNHYAATAWNGIEIMKGVKRFLQLLVNERIQLLAADIQGEVPSLCGALKQLKAPEVVRVYNEAFAAPDLVMETRSFNRQLNNAMDKFVQEVLYGQKTPEAALQGLLQAIKD
jgi:ABC-type glycerol-3-phosphate transport system substrate-binding protein